jgi:hypothetical protein
LRKQMLAAPGCAAKHRFRLPVTVKTEQAKDGAGASSNHIQAFIGRDQLIGHKLGGAVGIVTQSGIAQIFRHHGQGVDDRTETRPPAKAERPGQSGCIPGLDLLSKPRNAGERQLT